METKKYTTKQKTEILNVLKENKDKHLTANQMLECLSQKNVDVSKATLYRYLDVLVKSGSILKYMTSGFDKACFQYAENGNICKNHFHLKCNNCGKIIHLECNEITKIIAHIEDKHDFLVDLGTVSFYGTCDECLKEDGEINA